MSRALLLWTMVGAQALAADRVSRVRERRAADVEALLAKVGLRVPVDEVYLRAFKEEGQLELWAGRAGQPLVLVKTYPICAASGEPGPKRQEGDLQVPEGFYEVPEFNAFSSYHLAMKVSYPNASDRLRGDRQRPGGLIYLHGACASIGCIAIENGPIEEVYLVSLDARRRPIHFDIFPFRLTEERLAAPSPHQAFWRELYQGELEFQRTHRPPKVSVDPRTGAYTVRSR
jgi:murein L,D-transpeptidase YafK